VLRRPAPSSATSANRGLERRGFRDFRGAEPDTAVQVGPVRPRTVPAAFRVARYPGDEGPEVGHVLQGSRSVYFADDTDVNPEIAELSGVDLALLSVAGFIAGIEEMPFISHAHGSFFARASAKAHRAGGKNGLGGITGTRAPKPPKYMAGRSPIGHRGFAKAAKRSYNSLVRIGRGQS
jgi:hypothetical protein